MSSYSDNKNSDNFIIYLQATWSKNDISLVHEISFIYLNFFIIETEKSGHQCDHDADDRSFQLHETGWISITKCWNLFQLGTIEDVYMAL